MKDQLLYQIALTKIPNVGVKTAKTLISYCGSIEGVFHQKKRKLLKIPGIGEKTVGSICSADPEELAIPDLNYIENNQVKTLFFLDDDYPQRLKYLDDAPLLLFYKGSANWNHLRTAAIVGTRKPNDYGRSICRRLIEEITPFDIQVISGLAYGIDGIVHGSCISQNIENIGVMGTGIDVIYPSTHKQLASQIMQMGALITEYPIRMRADKENFPRRNRIIAGLADVTVLIQSAKKGGSMITAAFANGYHRDVVAFPGNCTHLLAAGGNYLIKHNLAHLIESAVDLASLMGWEKDQSTPKISQGSLFQDLDPEELDVLNLLKEDDTVHIDKIQCLLSIPPSALASILLQLEFKGIISSLPGKRYRIKPRAL